VRLERRDFKSRPEYHASSIPDVGSLLLGVPAEHRGPVEQLGARVSAGSSSGRCWQRGGSRAGTFGLRAHAYAIAICTSRARRIPPATYRRTGNVTQIRLVCARAGLAKQLNSMALTGRAPAGRGRQTSAGLSDQSSSVKLIRRVFRRRR